MTRTRNGSPLGTKTYEGDVDATIFRRVLLEIVQDFHAVEDIVTGEHSPTVPPVVATMNHDGTAGRGSLLGIPIVNQSINVRVGLSTADQLTFGSVVYLLAAPVFVASGETFFAVEVDAGVDTGLTLEVYDSAGALASEMPLSRHDDGTHRCWQGIVTTGAVYTFAIRCRIDGFWNLVGWRIFAPRLTELAGAPLFGQDGNLLMPVPTAPAGECMNIETIHDQMIGDNYALAGWVVNKLNRNIAALWEALTGAPIDGHASVTNGDSASTDPVTSRFIAHTRAGTDLVSEPLVDFPVLCEAWGAVRKSTGAPMVNDLSPPTVGLTTWFAPFPVDTSSSRGRIMGVYIPDFPNGAFTTLKMHVLCISEAAKGVPTNWQVRGSTSVASTPFVALTQLGSTKFYVATTAAVDFTPDAINQLSLEMQQSPASGFVFGELQVLGWCWSYEGTT